MEEQIARNTRRELLRVLGGSSALYAGSSMTVTATAGENPDGSVVFEPQETDGQTLEITELRTNVNAELQLEDPPSDNIYLQQDIAAGTEEENFVVELDRPIEGSTEIETWLWTKSNRETINVDSAFVSHENDPDSIGITFVEADSEYGFNYPYYLFNPPEEANEELPILVEPNNTGTATDNFEEHRDKALELLQHGDSNDISKELNVPLLVPVFPRPRTNTVNGNHYIHALDRETLAITDGDLKRVDLQLLRMVEHAKAEILSETAYTFRDDIILNGFSASGNFVDRFTVLHPERVLSVTAGGLNGMALLPLEEHDERTLDFHVGIADIEDLTQESVDLDALEEVNQFLYMGAEDTNDTIPYDDAWTEERLRQLALEVYGDDMIAERFPRCQEAYREAGVTAQFKIYDDIGHTTRGLTDDLVEYHRRSIADEDVTDFGESIVTEVTFEETPENPAVGSEIEFDASGTQAGVGELINYSWEFGDGETAVGEITTHAYEMAGTYDITLSVTDNNGIVNETTRTVEVRDEDGKSEKEEMEGSEEEADGSEDTPESERESITASFTAQLVSGSKTEIEFDASSSDPGESEIASYSWDFDTGESAAGKIVTASFDKVGTYHVELMIVTDTGERSTTTTPIIIADHEDQSQHDNESGSEFSTDSDGVPGLGVGSAIASLGGAVYVLKNRVSTKNGQ